MNRQNAMIIIILTQLMHGTSHADVVTTVKGQSPGAEMKIKQSKVPQFDLVQKRNRNGQVELVRIKNIPRLNIGQEDQVKAKDLSPLKLPTIGNVQINPVTELKSPSEIFIDLESYKKINSVNPPKALVPEVLTAPTEPLRFPEVPKPIPQEPQLQQVEMEDMNPSRMKLLQALIFLEIKQDYSMALALFAELLKDEIVQIEATYQLALTSLKLGLYSEYKFRMQQVLGSSDPEWQKKAALNLAINAAEGDKDLVAIVDPKIAQHQIELKNADQYQMNRAKYYLDRGDLTLAFSAVDEIQLDAELYLDALFLKSMILYKGGQIQEAIGLAQVVYNKLIETKARDADFTSMAALTLARLYFQAGQYKESFDQYLKVDKKSPDWLQAMVEQAWTQILSQDYEGAAGNMFSLHTDFFKKSFAPESYVARTVGYLNLCQFGDGAKVIFEFKKSYLPVLKQLNEYGKKMDSNTKYYDTIKTWVQNPDLKVVDGLPREFIFTLTRHPSFILEQKLINSVEDEVANLNKINLNLIRTERRSLADANDARAKLVQLKKDGNQEAIKEQEKRLLSSRIQHYIAKKARTSIKQLRTEASNRLNEEKLKYRDRAGAALKSRFIQMLTRLNESLDQSEVLQYELYSGAGEHLRYQMAGGKINEKERPELKVEPGKSLNWEFKGEIWEDELGHYRSSLKNVCAPEER